MKSIISIRGKISGNKILKEAIAKNERNVTNDLFNSFVITFPTKKAAINALAEAYRLLKEQPEPITDEVKYSQGKFIKYYNSIAEIE